GRPVPSRRAPHEELERLPIAVRAFSDHALRREVAEHGVLPPLLAVLDVGQVHLHDGRLEQLERVADRVRVVRPGTGIGDDAVGPVERVVAPLDELPFVVRLPATDVAAELGAPLVDAGLELREREPAVERWIAAREHVQIHAVQDDHLHGAPLYSAISPSSAERTSVSGLASTTGPSSFSSTSRSSPPHAFLSRCIAAQARSRSTRTGCGRSSCSTISVGRPDRRSAASNPSATARPCVSPSYPAAASSACANV